MLRLLGQSPSNSWEPEPLDLERIEHEVRFIEHRPQQDVCILTEQEAYVEIVIYNGQLHSSLKRFILAPDYYWSEEEEEDFSSLVRREGIACSAFHLNAVFEGFSVTHPEWHLRIYANKPLRLIDHIYHCQHPGSVKEILYKAGLDEIAVQIDRIDGFNMIGSSPADIFSGLNMRLLKAINIPEGIQLIDEEWKRERLLELQSRYAWMFEKKWNAAMCQYMNQLLAEEAVCEDIARKIRRHYKRLCNCWIQSQWTAYIDFIHQKECVYERLGEFIRKNAMDMDDLYIRKLYRYLIVEKKEWDRKIRASNKKRNHRYEFEDNTFKLFYPHTIEDFVVESRKQRNCLLEYLHAYADNITDILLMRDKKNPTESYVTVEIYRNQIRQAYTRFNEEPEERAKQWLREYAKRMGIELYGGCFGQR